MPVDDTVSAVSSTQEPHGNEGAYRVVSGLCMVQIRDLKSTQTSFPK